MQNEGYIKFDCLWTAGQAVDRALVSEINDVRTRLFHSGYIGMYPDGTGYGNISLRVGGDKFLITGTQTGGIDILDGSHYTLVEGFDIGKNLVECRGPVKASSESLTHAVVYRALPGVNAVIHVHSAGLWKKLLDRVPTTSPDVEYGTPAMAWEVIRLIESTDLMEVKIFAMAGHEEGIVAFGRDIMEAYEILKHWEVFAKPS